MASASKFSGVATMSAASGRQPSSRFGIRTTLQGAALFGFWTLLHAATALATHGAQQPVATSGGLRVGAAKVDITPKELTSLNPMGGKTFAGVHDPIYARALVLESGKDSAAIVTLDLIEAGDTSEVRRRIAKELGIPFDHIMISATHDHSAPRLGDVTPGALAHGGGPESAAYTRRVNDDIVQALRAAKAALQPATFGRKSGSADVNVNRDQYSTKGWQMGADPDRPSTKTVWVMKFQNAVGEPIAILINYAVHSTATLGANLVSGDIAGAAERYVEQHAGGTVVALWTMGPAGDQNPRFAAFGMVGDPPAPGAPQPARDPEEMSRAGFEAMDAQGFMVGAEAVRVAKLIQTTTSTVRLEADEQVFSCPIKQGVNQMADMKQAPAASVPIRLGLIMLNQVALVGVSGEVVTNIYTHLKKSSPLTDTIMVTIANDRIGYIADDAAYDTPYFEVNGTPAARGCAESGIVDGLVGMIDSHLNP
jgi:neutral ceramidase